MSPFWILLELRVMEVVVTTGAIRRAKFESDHHHQQNNIRDQSQNISNIQMTEVCIFAVK